jgi:hypothetical protein
MRTGELGNEHFHRVPFLLYDVLDEAVNVIDEAVDVVCQVN